MKMMRRGFGFAALTALTALTATAAQSADAPPACGDLFSTRKLNMMCGLPGRSDAVKATWRFVDSCEVGLYSKKC